MNPKERTKRLYFGYLAIGRGYEIRKDYPHAHSVNEIAGYVASRVIEDGLAEPQRVYYLGKDGQPLAGYIRKD